MNTSIDLAVGSKTWSVSVSDSVRVELRRRAFAAPTAGPRELVRAALETPFGFDSPLRRALTPDDRVTLVLDEGLPRVAEILGAVIEHLGTAGVPPTAVTVLVPPTDAGSPWIEDLPDEFSDVTLEVHDPEERTKLAYLATTKAGHRIYLNRSLVEADFVIVLTGRGFDPTFGYAGAEAAVYPALSDAETLAGFVGRFSTDNPNGKLTAETTEVTWLLGTPFFVQVIEGDGDDVQEVIGGLPDSTAEGTRRQEARWRTSVDERPSLVIATVGSADARVDFNALAAAAETAAKVVRPGGRVVVLSSAAPPLHEGAELLRQADDPATVGRMLQKRKPDDWPAAARWASAATRANLFVASGWPDEVTEELFATPLRSAAEVQRLINAAERVLVIPDAHKTVVDLR